MLRLASEIWGRIERSSTGSWLWAWRLTSSRWGRQRQKISRNRRRRPRLAYRRWRHRTAICKWDFDSKGVFSYFFSFISCYTVFLPKKYARYVEMSVRRRAVTTWDVKSTPFSSEKSCEVGGVHWLSMIGLSLELVGTIGVMPTSPLILWRISSHKSGWSRQFTVRWNLFGYYCFEKILSSFWDEVEYCFLYNFGEGMWLLPKRCSFLVRK